MSRIPSHTVEDAPEASRVLLQEMIQFSPTGRPLNMHAQMAHSPAVLEAYVSLRRATARLGTLDQAVRAALMLASAAAAENRYAVAVLSMLALRSGWHQDQVDALRPGPSRKDGAATGSVTARGGRHTPAGWLVLVPRALGQGW